MHGQESMTLPGIPRDLRGIFERPALMIAWGAYDFTNPVDDTVSGVRV